MVDRAWGDDLVDLDLDLEADGVDCAVNSIDWNVTGRFVCDQCDRSFTKLVGLRDHAGAVHGPAYAAELVRLVKVERRREVEAERQKKIAIRLAAEARASRVIPMSAADIDEIVGEMLSLIGMMEPYWSQGEADRDAQVLIGRLQALADGLVPAEGRA